MNQNTNNNADRTSLYTDIGRTSVSEQYFSNSINNNDLTNHNFYGVVAKKKRFTKVNFQHSRFDRCVFRKCTFDSCDFNDCHFSESDLKGSIFTDCRMDYSTFSKTAVDVDILRSTSPNRENLKMRFARTLRKNYESLGDSDAVNQSVLVELEATRAHLKKGWDSDERYYRDKYQGLARFKIFLAWTFFCFSDHIWGNGEKPQKLLRSFFEVIALMALADVFLFSPVEDNKGFFSAITDSTSAFLGVNYADYLPILYICTIAFVKFIFFGLLISILVKRFNRR